MVRVAVLGAGPTGLEAALAAHDRAWDVAVYEQAGEVAGYVREWAHVRMFTPWAMNVSARIQQELDVPGAGCPTGGEFAAFLDRAAGLLPAGTVHLSTRVRALARDGLLKSDEIGTSVRASRPFRLLLAGAEGSERIDTADVVVDCTGTYGNPNPTGNGGIPALGEDSVDVLRQIPAVDASWRARRVLLVGAGNSAQTAARDLVAAGAQLTWVVRGAQPHWGAVAQDPLPARAALVASSHSIQRSGRVIQGVVVDSLQNSGSEVVVTLRGPQGTRTVTVDRVLSLTGSAPDAALYRQLQVHECYATEGPIALAATLLDSAGTDCLAQTSAGVDVLRNPEPRFFVLGAKSYGRNNSFLLRVGWEQVSEVFAALDADLSAFVATESQVPRAHAEAAS
ncbi:MAG: FAD-dependent oxidoreductase [Mycobacteriales bacterium]